jgi:basic membrane lipoprotein Med (substrate-binding protein (PBP1-ABC) superfamily)
VKDVLDGKWNTSPYKARYRAGLKEGVVDLAPFGRVVPDAVQKTVLAQKQAIVEGRFVPFTGPVKDQTGTIRIPAGAKPSVTELEKTDYLVEGVIGTIPR